MCEGISSLSFLAISRTCFGSSEKTGVLKGDLEEIVGKLPFVSSIYYSISFISNYSKSSVSVYVTTNIPDGAAFLCSAYECNNPDEWDSKFVFTNEPAIVKDSKFIYSFKLYDKEIEADFTDNTILFDMSFSPWATIQPQAIVEYYYRELSLRLMAGSPGFITPGPPAGTSRKNPELSSVCYKMKVIP